MANLNRNKVEIAGHITKDIVLAVTMSGLQTAQFTIATTRTRAKADANGNKPTDFIECSAFGKTAENIAKYFRKGSSIVIDGYLTNNNYIDGIGNKHYTYRVIVNEFDFVDSVSNGSQTQSAGYIPEAYSSEPITNANAPKFEDIGEEDNLPF